MPSWTHGSRLLINAPIVEEIRTFRAVHAVKYGNDLGRIFLALKENEKQHTYKLVPCEDQRALQK